MGKLAEEPDAPGEALARWSRSETVMDGLLAGAKEPMEASDDQALRAREFGIAR